MLAAINNSLTFHLADHTIICSDIDNIFKRGNEMDVVLILSVVISALLSAIITYLISKKYTVKIDLQNESTAKQLEEAKKNCRIKSRNIV